MVALLIFLRLGFFATLENPEPRYTVELFPLLMLVGGVGLSVVVDRITRLQDEQDIL